MSRYVPDITTAIVSAREKNVNMFSVGMVLFQGSWEDDFLQSLLGLD